MFAEFYQQIVESRAIEGLEGLLPEAVTNMTSAAVRLLESGSGVKLEAIDGIYKIVSH